MGKTVIQRKKAAPVAKLGLRGITQSLKSSRSYSDFVLSSKEVPTGTPRAKKQNLSNVGGSRVARIRRNSSTDEIDKSLAVFAAGKNFVSTAANMGWQLALTVLVPLVIGVKLDNYYRTTPSYTLAALIIAVGMAVMVVARTIKLVNVKTGKSR